MCCVLWFATLICFCRSRCLHKKLFICGLSLKATVVMFMVHKQLVILKDQVSLPILYGFAFSRFFVFYILLLWCFIGLLYLCWLWIFALYAASNKSLKIRKVKPEAVNQMTDNTMAKGESWSRKSNDRHQNGQRI